MIIQIIIAEDKLHHAFAFFSSLLPDIRIDGADRIVAIPPVKILRRSLEIRIVELNYSLAASEIRVQSLDLGHIR